MIGRDKEVYNNGVLKGVQLCIAEINKIHGTRGGFRAAVEAALRKLEKASDDTQ